MTLVKLLFLIIKTLFSKFYFVVFSARTTFTQIIGAENSDENEFKTFVINVFPWEQMGWWRTLIASFCYQSIWVKSKSTRSAYDVKAYVVLIATRPSDRDIEPGSPLSTFRKEQTNAGIGFLLHLIMITQILHYNSTYARVFTLDI